MPPFCWFLAVKLVESGSTPVPVEQVEPIPKPEIEVKNELVDRAAKIRDYQKHSFFTANQMTLIENNGKIP
jgi:hypothetical protein